VAKRRGEELKSGSPMTVNLVAPGEAPSCAGDGRGERGVVEQGAGGEVEAARVPRTRGAGAGVQAGGQGLSEMGTDGDGTQLDGGGTHR
jgi:hypothetical protein